MKWLYLFAMMYMSVAGGPFGVEDVLHKVPLYESLGILILASFTHLLPSAMMTYEMVKVYDHNELEGTGGTIGWVEKTMGKRVGLINAVYNIVDTAVDNSIYPVIIKDNLGIKGPVVPIVVCVICCFLNWTNTEMTGKITVIQTLFVLSPFICLCLVTPVDDNMFVYTREYEYKDRLAQYQEALMIMVWNLSGFDMCASYIHTMKASLKQIRFSITLTVVVTVIVYILVLCCGTYYLHDRSEWVDGSWSEIGFMKFGDWGRSWFQLASIVSSTATLCVELCATAYLWMGLVEVNAVPNIFKNFKFNLLLNTALTVVLSITQTFETLVEVSALLNVATIVFEAVAWLTTYGAGTWYIRAIMAILLIGINICVSLCLSTRCVTAMVTASALGVAWLASVEIKSKLCVKGRAHGTHYETH